VPPMQPSAMSPIVSWLSIASDLGLCGLRAGGAGCAPVPLCVLTRTHSHTHDTRCPPSPVRMGTRGWSDSHKIRGARFSRVGGECSRLPPLSTPRCSSAAAPCASHRCPFPAPFVGLATPLSHGCQAKVTVGNFRECDARHVRDSRARWLHHIRASGSTPARDRPAPRVPRG
jgi:hypothetical protein